jgi:hypothetical protein
MPDNTTLKQRFLNTFAHKKIDRIVFSPRIYYWYLGNSLFLRRNVEKKLKIEIPPHYLRKSQLEIYDYLRASPRYVMETLYLPIIETKINSDANIQVISQKGSKPGETIIIHKTPIGNLTQTTAVGGGLGVHFTEFPVKSLDDIKIMKYIMENTQFSFSREYYNKAKEQLEDRGVVSDYLFSSPYQRMVKTQIGFVNTVILLKRYPKQIEGYIKFLEDWDDRMYNIIAKSPYKIINFGENIDSNLSPPRYFEKYLIPYYEKRVKQLHDAGKYCHIHMDGSLRDLLPYLDDLPFDGLEALTPEPQGDVTLEELGDSIGNKILLDGIPSILFLPEYNWEYVKDYIMKLLELFSPNLILGVSDELSPNGDIRKLEKISDIIQEFEL